MWSLRQIKACRWVNLIWSGSVVSWQLLSNTFSDLRMLQATWQVSHQRLVITSKFTVVGKILYFLPFKDETFLILVRTMTLKNLCCRCETHSVEFKYVPLLFFFFKKINKWIKSRHYFFFGVLKSGRTMVCCDIWWPMLNVRQRRLMKNFICPVSKSHCTQEGNKTKHTQIHITH